MFNIKKNLQKICLGLAFLSGVSFAPTMVQASQLTLLNGWINQNHSWYHYDFGQKETGWLKDNGNWYFLSRQGTMQTGWQKINGDWYYFHDDGSMATNTTVNGYYLGSSGTWVE